MIPTLRYRIPEVKQSGTVSPTSLHTLSDRAILAEVRNAPRTRGKRKRGNATNAETVADNDDQDLCLLDRLIRWQAFLFFSNFRWLELLHEVYGADLSADSFRYTIGRTRTFNNIKAYKNKVLSRMELA